MKTSEIFCECSCPNVFLKLWQKYCFCEPLCQILEDMLIHRKMAAKGWACFPYQEKNVQSCQKLPCWFQNVHTDVSWLTLYHLDFFKFCSFVKDFVERGQNISLSCIRWYGELWGTHLKYLTQLSEYCEVNILSMKLQKSWSSANGAVTHSAFTKYFIILPCSQVFRSVHLFFQWFYFNLNHDISLQNCALILVQSWSKWQKLLPLFWKKMLRYHLYTLEAPFLPV